MTVYHREYIWEWPVRFWHWAHFAAMVVLSITGYYIGNPFLTPAVAAGGGMAAAAQGLGLMAGVRLIHFSAAILLTVSLLVRLYWFFQGNQYSRWRDWVPLIGRKQIETSARLLREQVRYYLFLRRDAPHGAGHNPLAALSYYLMLLLLIVETVTGWALYGLGAPHSIFARLTSWVFSITTDQTLRFSHHAAMWLLIAFFAVHLYLAIRDDNLGELGTMSSMFGGYKLMRSGEPEEKV